MTEISYEYTTGTCDVWQLGHLANFFADKRWEPVFAEQIAETASEREVARVR